MRNIWTPDVCIRELQKRISKQERAAFYGALIVGLMTHSYAFFNKLYNYDELSNTPSGVGIAAGNNRWFLELSGRVTSSLFGGSFSLPFLNGLATLLLIAVSALLVVRMLGLKSVIFSIFTGAFMTAFPALTGLYLFMFLAPHYAIGIFLSVLGAYLVVQFPGKITANVLSVVCIACATGTYQAYFPNTVCIFMISIILICTFGEERNWKNIFFLALRYVIVLAAGMLFYFVLNRILLNVWGIGITIEGYQGLDTMGQITAAELVDSIKRCYESFWMLGFGNVHDLNNMGLVMKAIRLVLLIFGASVAAMMYLKKGEWIKKCFMLAAFFLFPVGMFLTYIMAPTAYYYTLMGYPVVFLFILMAVWADYFYQFLDSHGGLSGGKLYGQVVQWCSTLVSVVVIVVYIWYANGCYMSLEYTKMHDMSYFQTMVTQIKSLEGYSDELKLALIGEDIDDSGNQAGDLIGLTFTMGGKSWMTNVNGKAGVHLIAKYLGYTPTFCSYEELVYWMEREEFKAMPAYPDDGSIQIFGDTIVVKLTEYEE